jgi:tetratricopeptide (TPR) repeat protein
MNRRPSRSLWLALAALPSVWAAPIFEDELASPSAAPAAPVQVDSLFEEPAVVRPPLPGRPPVLSAPSGVPAPVAPTELAVPRSVAKKDPVFEIPAPEIPPAPAPEPQLSVPELLRLGRYPAVIALASEKKDGNLAEAIAWRYYEDLDFDRAERWFAQAIRWGNTSRELYHGLALIYFSTGDDAKAEAITRRYLAEDARMREMHGDILVRRAVDARSPAVTADTLREAAKFRHLSKNEELTLAWSDLKAGRRKEAADLFEAIYRVHRDEESAAGLESSLGSIGDQGRLAKIADEAPGPLENPIKAAQIISPGVTYFNRGLYGAALEADPKTYAPLAPVIAPSVAVGTRIATKSGTDGLSQLTTVELPVVTARLTAYSRHDLEARISRMSIDTGTVPAGTRVGNTPEIIVPPPVPDPLPSQPGRDIDDYEWSLRYRYQGLWSPFVGVSQAARSGVIGDKIDWEFGIQRFHTAGYLQARAFTRPVRDSLLSLDGLRDPYGSSVWGRVSETGVTFSAYQQLNDRDSFYTQLTAGKLSGRRVADNTHVGFRASLARAFRFDNQATVSIGPGVSIEHYRENLSHFTLGHGGYFSPNYMLQGDFGAQYSTREGRNWLFTAGATLGYQRNRQSSAPFFPLAPDGRDHRATEAADITYGLSARAGMLVDKRWIVGGGFGMNSAADYDDFMIGLFLRYVFANRDGVTSGDLVW